MGTRISRAGYVCFSTAVAQKAAPVRIAANNAMCQQRTPGEHEELWRKAGVEDFIYAGCDVLAALQRL
jgi:hypothetical protein